MKTYEIDKQVDIKRLIKGCSDTESFDCDFHNDDGNAFIEDNHYQCKCCGIKLTPSQYISQTMGISRNESLASLYRIKGESIPPWLIEGIRPNLDGFKLHKRLLDIFKKELHSNKEMSNKCLNYIVNQRKLSKETTDHFNLGFFPKGKDFVDKLIDEFGEELLQRYGILTEGRFGLYSNFNNRLMFPIHNKLDQVCGFGSRTLDKDVKPKYINSMASDIFSKSELLYTDRKQKKERGIVTEGYMDVISCSASCDDFSYYASLGTALNSLQLRDMLKRHEHVTICTDGDDAGQNSIYRFIKTQLSNVEQERVSFVKIPLGMDPDEFIQANGSAAFVELIGESLPAKAFIKESFPNADELLINERFDQFNLAP